MRKTLETASTSLLWNKDKLSAGSARSEVLIFGAFLVLHSCLARKLLQTGLYNKVKSKGNRDCSWLKPSEALFQLCGRDFTLLKDGEIIIWTPCLFKLTKGFRPTNILQGYHHVSYHLVWLYNRPVKKSLQGVFFLTDSGQNGPQSWIFFQL